MGRSLAGPTSLGLQMLHVIATSPGAAVADHKASEMQPNVLRWQVLRPPTLGAGQDAQPKVQPDRPLPS